MIATNVFAYNVDESGPRSFYEQASDPSPLSNTGWAYTKDILGLTELFFEDNTGNVLQITSGGALSSTVIPANVVDKTTATATYYVATTGTDNSTCGPAASPCLTREYLYDNILPDMIDDNIVVDIASGTYYDVASLDGKLFGASGTLTIRGATTELLADQVATGGDNENASGLGETTVSGAAWVVNAYAGKWIRFLTSTSPSEVITSKYVPIISNDATTLVTPRLLFTPTSATTFDVVSLDTILSGASAVAPNTAVNVIEEITEITTSTDAWYDGVYFRYPLTYESLDFKNGYGLSIRVTNSQALFTGIGFNSTDNTNTGAGFYSTGGATSTYIYGAYGRGELPRLIDAANNSVVFAFDIYGDYTTYTGSGHVFPMYFTSGSTGYIGDYAFIGDAADRINSAFYAYGSGSYLNLSQGHVAYSNNILRTGGHGYGIFIYSDKVFGSNNQTLYNASFFGTFYETSQANAAYTLKFEMDDTSQGTAAGTNYNYAIRNLSFAKTVVAADEIMLEDQENVVLTATGPITLTATPTIEAGIYEGQRKTLWGTSDTNTITLQDSDNAAGTTLEFIGNVNRVLKADDKVDLYWDATASKWEEINTTFQNAKFTGATGTKNIYLDDNQASALSVVDATSNVYLTFETTTSGEKISTSVNFQHNTTGTSASGDTSKPSYSQIFESSGWDTDAGGSAVTKTQTIKLVPVSGANVFAYLSLIDDSTTYARLGKAGTVTTPYLAGEATSSGSAIGVSIGSANNFTTAGDKLVSFRNNIASTGGTEKAYVDYLGSFNAGPGTALLPSYSFVADPNTGIWNASANGIGFATDGVNRMTLGTQVLDTTGIGKIINVTNVNAATYDLVATDEILDVSYTGTAAVTSLTLPTAQMIKGRSIVIKDTGLNAGVNNITIDTEGAELIDGADTYVMDANKESIQIFVNAAGTGWFILY
jgi:hypothetical protein